MALSNTATPKYYGMFREAVRRGEIPVNREISMEMNRIDALIKDRYIYYDENAINGWILYSEGEMTLSVADATGGSATEVLTVDQSGAGVDIGLNSKYTLEALAQADKGNVVIHYDGSMSPVLVTYEKEPGFKAVIMPLRIA